MARTGDSDLRGDRDLRKDLLLAALDRFDDLDKAFEAVLRMERFILAGEAPAAAPTRSPARSADEHSDSVLPPTVATGEEASLLPEARFRKTISRNRWRREDDQLLRELWGKSLTVKEVAKRLDRTPASIYGRVHQLGLTPRRAETKAGRWGAAASHPKKQVAKKVDDDPSEFPQAPSGVGLRPIEGQVAIDEVIRFLRTRDYSIISTDDGRYKVDGRHVLTAEELLHRANRVRESLGHCRWQALSKDPRRGQSVSAG